MIAIAISLFNKKITDGLLDGCLRALKENGYKRSHINIYEVPGAFELPAKVQFLNSKTKYNCIIALGCVIKGETDHYHYICQAVTNGIMSVTLDKKMKNKTSNIIFGVLTCQNKELALLRSSDDMKKNKGYEAGNSAIKIIQS